MGTLPAVTLTGAQPVPADSPPFQSSSRPRFLTQDTCHVIIKEKAPYAPGCAEGVSAQRFTPALMSEDHMRPHSLVPKSGVPTSSLGTPWRIKVHIFLPKGHVGTLNIAHTVNKPACKAACF